MAENCASKRSIDTYPWRYENPEKGYHFYPKVMCSKKFFVENSREMTSVTKSVVFILSYFHVFFMNIEIFREFL